MTLLGLTTLLVVCLYSNWFYTLLGLVLLVPLLWLSGRLITYLVSRQASKSKEHDVTQKNQKWQLLNVATDKLYLITVNYIHYY